jgi:hypothetical protein
MEEIGVLLASPPEDVTLVERTLTDGYATALTLETERLRLEKQIRAVAASMERGDVRQKSRELSELTRRVERSDDDLAMLRTLLARLRGEYSAMREDASPHAERAR